MCRWLERDPAGYQDGPSLYSYLGRNPMAGTDPYGLASDDGSHVPEPVDIPSSQRRTPGAPIQPPGAGLRLSMVGADHPFARLQRAEDARLRQCRHPFGSDGEFDDVMRINPDRAEGLRELAGGIRTWIETTASLLPGGGFATGVNEASQGNFGAAALGVIPGAKAVKVLRKGSKAAKVLPALDSTGKVHGRLPRVEDLGRYDPDELRQLSKELQESVQERIRKTTELGRDKGHGSRQAAEQQLIKAIERHLQQYGN